MRHPTSPQKAYHRMDNGRCGEPGADRISLRLTAHLTAIAMPCELGCVPRSCFYKSSNSSIRPVPCRRGCEGAHPFPERKGGEKRLRDILTSVRVLHV
eukprot:scaffold137637_cov33-Prasinocladus_malaysianus.AAC.1